MDFNGIHLKSKTAFKTTFRALKHRNFRLFFAGQSVSLVGTWMQQIAMSWLVYRITGSALMLGFVGFLSQIPSFVLSPFAGVLIDRIDRRRILAIAQILFMLQALSLALLTLTGAIEVWHILVLGVFFGCVGAVEIPARQSFIIEMVEHKEYLGNAIALNSLMFNSARLIGPSIAGILIAAVGEGPCFLLNAFSFIPVIWSLLAMRIKARPAVKSEKDMLEGLREGFTYTFGSLPIRSIIMLLSVMSVMGTSYMILMPVYAKDILGGGPNTFGFLMASAGVGSVAATFFLAAEKNMGRLMDFIPVFSVIFAVSLVVFSFSRAVWLSALLLAFVGFAFMVHMAASNTIIQTIVDDDKRGRVMSFYTAAFIGMAPVGSLIAGSLASRIGATSALAISGTLCIIAALCFASRISTLKSLVQPILIRTTQ
ncbi:MAG: MFS transporter [Candidatus Omnitrophica bacterium]|nr:MFS transporter [Candidatus Omnitrophota bacterium]